MRNTGKIPGGVGACCPGLTAVAAVYRQLLKGPHSTTQLQTELAMPTPELASALTRLSKSLCICQIDDQFKVGCDSSASIVREAIELLTRELRRGKQVNLEDDALRSTACCRRPPIQVKHLEEAIERMVETG